MLFTSPGHEKSFLRRTPKRYFQWCMKIICQTGSSCLQGISKGAFTLQDYFGRSNVYWYIYLKVKKATYLQPAGRNKIKKIMVRIQSRMLHLLCGYKNMEQRWHLPSNWLLYTEATRRNWRRTWILKANFDHRRGPFHPLSRSRSDCLPLHQRQLGTFLLQCCDIGQLDNPYQSSDMLMNIVLLIDELTKFIYRFFVWNKCCSDLLLSTFIFHARNVGLDYRIVSFRFPVKNPSDLG